MHPDELMAWFDHIRNVLETSYTAYPNTEPWRQSGMSGPEGRWVSLRQPVADCLDHSGSFLDIGCAIGYLLECILGWAAARNLAIDPYGLDISSRLVELARERLPGFSTHFFAGNSFTWVPPFRFDFVQTELVYVPADYEMVYIQRLVEDYLKPDGRLILTNYGEGLTDPRRGLLPGCFATNDILAHLSDLGVTPAGYRDGYDPIQDRRTRFVIVTRESLSPVSK